MKAIDTIKIWGGALTAMPARPNARLTRPHETMLAGSG
jgi:hypothetical protein